MTKLPLLLSEQASQCWQRLLESEPLILSALTDEQQQATQCAFAMSDYIAEQCIRRPQLLIDIWAVEALVNPINFDSYRQRLHRELKEQSDDNGAKRILRLLRNEVMVIVAWQELCFGLKAQQSIQWMSQLANCCIQGAVEWLYPMVCKDFGTPSGPAGDAQPLVVIGMGKLGGGELNFSSDIDLIFSYPHNGETQGGRRSIANQQFFIRMGQRFIQLLDQVTVDGFVFRVDMRLRPFGESGPLAVSFSALEDYYQNHGRDWERYAMVKARSLNDEQMDSELTATLRPFIYRRYIDYSAVQALRSMKTMINSEVRRKGLVDNIKLGAGGIREIEFIVQAFQLIRGGREPKLRSRSLLAALDALTQCGGLDVESGTQLKEYYLYLRRVENLLQQFGDQQTQTLPSEALGRERLRYAMGHGDWQTFYTELSQVQSSVNAIFESTIGDDEQKDSSNAIFYNDLWHIGADRQAITDFISGSELDSAHHTVMANALYSLCYATEHRSLGSRGRQTLERLMPQLLEKLFESDHPQRVAPRVIALLERILSRTAYLELLAENLGTLTQLIRLCDASAMVAEKLASFPILLDELLDPNVLYQPVSPDSYALQLREFLMRIPVEDMEQQMEALRQFKQIQHLRVAAADIAGALPLMKVSDHLTAIAEAIINAVVEQAWYQMTLRYGMPAGLKNEMSKGFAVIGYGKLGGIEFGYSSDIDLVFIHNCTSSQPTDGKRSIDSKEFYLKLAQRIMHLFNSRTTSGILYELDMRLRPSGSAGLLVSELGAFERYQLNDAWTWEHQALVRARSVYGDADLVADFAKVRQTILSMVRNPQELAEQVVEMRQKMRDHLDRGDATNFDLKQSPGGMVDIEFIAQYLVLANSHQLCDMTIWSDNVRIFETCDELGVLDSGSCQQLISAYLDIRDESHRQVLQNNHRVALRAEFASQVEIVQSIWQQLLIE